MTSYGNNPANPGGVYPQPGMPYPPPSGASPSQPNIPPPPVQQQPPQQFPPQGQSFNHSGEFNPHDPRMQDPRNQPYMGNSNTPRTPVAKVPREKTFEIDYYSETDGFHYKGFFTVRKPTLADRNTIALMKSSYMGGMYHDEMTPGKGVPEWLDQFSEMRAYLDTLLVRWPEWWAGSAEITDLELAWLIFEEAAEIDPFLGIQRRSSDGSTGTPDREASYPEPHQAQPGGDLEDLVDENLPTPSDKP